MSNHFSAANLKSPGDDARLDLTELFVFAAPDDPDRTVLIMDANPFTNGNGFHPDAVYRFNIDTNGDALADVAFSFEAHGPSRVPRDASAVLAILEDPMTVEWDDVTRAEVLRAIQEYDRVGPEEFFSEHGFAPTTTYDLLWDERRYPPKAILGTAYEFATGQRLASGDFEGGKTGAVRVLGNLGFTIRPRRPAS